jgi:hypothetical protein
MTIIVPNGHQGWYPRALMIMSALAASGGLSGAAAGEAKPPPWFAQLDHGPFLADTIAAPGDNIAIKGYAVKLSATVAGRPMVAGMCFDTDLMRWSAGWRGEFLRLTGDAWDGQHNQGPFTAGTPVFATHASPGCSYQGGFADPRSEPFGPLPATWARYRGLYVHGDRVVLSYAIGKGGVLELPGLEADGRTLSRTLQLSELPATTLVVAELAGGTGTVADGIATLAADKVRIGVALIGAPAEARLAVADGRIVLMLPATRSGLLKLLIGDADAAELSALRAAPLTDPSSLISGGPARSTATVETRGVLGTETGPYVVDTLTAPEENPFNTRPRFAGLDFLPDGRAAISSWNGDVWIVSGIDSTLAKLTWRRFAAGLHHPLGLKVVDGRIYALCRDGITRLTDLNNDGEADFYENFTNEVHTTPAFHEFAFDLWTDQAGAFYFGKAGPVKKGGRGFETIARDHGSLLKVSRDGATMETFATGLRAPNGISVGPHDEITSGDNEGTWTPTSRINLIRKGGFYGVVDLAHRAEKPTATDPPICWLPHQVENSCGGQVWVTSDRWGPLGGQLMHLSYGTCGLFVVAWGMEGDVPQGGAVRLPLTFATGVMRGRFNPGDGQLYVCGLKGWQTTAAKQGAFQRVRYTGKPVHLPVKMQVRKNGIALTFTAPLDPATVVDLENWNGEQWNYLWSEAYGSPEFKPSDPAAKGHDPIAIRSVVLSADGRTVFVEIPAIRPVMQFKLGYKLKAADGTAVAQDFYGTINQVGATSGP